MEKNYYPLRIGKYESVIVSDTDPGRTRQPDEREVEHYGGYLIAESIPSKLLAQQLVDAYNEKHGPQTKTHPLIVVVGEPYSSRHKIIQASDLMDDPNDFSEAAAVKAMDKLNLMLEKEPIVVVLKKMRNGTKGYIGSELMNKSSVCVCLQNSEPKEHGVMDKDLQSVMFDHKNVIRTGPSPSDTLADYMARLDKSFSKINDYLMDKYFSQNSAHSFTEGADVEPELCSNTLASIDKQIKFIRGKREEAQSHTSNEMYLLYRAIEYNLQAIKHWRESPVYHDVNVEKVIEDLVTHVKLLEKHDHFEFNVIDKHNSALQNAEAALGMLQAFKENAKKEPSYTEVIKTLRKCLQDTEAPGNVNGIIWAVEELIKLHAK